MIPRSFFLLSTFLTLWVSLSLTAHGQDDFRDQYLLRAGDRLALEVFEEPELTTSVAVSRTGNVSLTYINNVKVGGLTIPEAAELIKERYGEYLKNPVLTLRIEEYAAELVTVIGQVNSPGEIPLPQSGKIEVASALATAGGVTEFADPENIKLTRSGGEEISLSVSAIRGDQGSITMTTGDKLVVHESPNAHSKVWVAGEVNKPGPLALPKTGKMDVASALASAGGPSETANLDAIKIIPAKGNPSTLSYDRIQNPNSQRVFLKDGDQLLVTKSPYANTTVTILGEVKSPGRVAFPVDGDFDLMEAIGMAGGFTELANLKKVTVTRNGASFTRDVRDYGKNAQNPPIQLQPSDIVTVAERWF